MNTSRGIALDLRFARSWIVLSRVYILQYSVIEVSVSTCYSLCAESYVHPSDRLPNGPMFNSVTPRLNTRPRPQRGAHNRYKIRLTATAFTGAPTYVSDYNVVKEV